MEKAADAYPRLLTEQSDLLSRIRDIERQLDDLKTDPISPGAVEVKCSQLLKEQNIQHWPLHQVIAELLADDDPRKSQWLAQAHNLLFAPVLDSVEQAMQAAELLVQHRQPVPVFTRESLQNAVTNNQPLLGAVIGYESLAVRALLNPQFIEELRQQLQDRLADSQVKLDRIKGELELYHHDSDSVRLAKSAAEAIEQQAEGELPKQQAALEHNRSRQQQLLEQLAPENRKLIYSAERFLELGGSRRIDELGVSLNQLQSKLDRLEKQLSQLESQLNGDNRRKLDQAEQFLSGGGKQRLAGLQADIELQTIKQQQLTEQQEQCQESITSYQGQIAQCKAQADAIYQPGEADLLISLANYLQEGGPEFMANAETVQKSLEGQQEQAQARASLKFDRIRAYLSARNDEGVLRH